MRIVLFHYFGTKPNPVYDILSNVLRKRGHEVIVGTISEDGVFQWRGAGNDIVAEMPLEQPPSWVASRPSLAALYRRWFTLGMMFKSRSMIKELQPDIVQVNSNNWPWILALFGPPSIHVTYDIRQINEAVTPSLRSRLRERQVLQSWSFWSRLGFERTFFCHVEAAKRVLGEHWEAFGTVVPVGEDDRFLAIDSARLVSPGKNDRVHMVYVGTLSRLRNLEQLFYAAALLSKETEDFHLTLVGPDKSNGFLQRKIEELAVTDFVTIRPPLDYEQVPEFLAQFHVGLAYVPDRPTGHYQPTLKVLEYRALGLPILSTDVLSHRGLVQDGVNGVMVSDTPESIAQGMRRLVLDREFLQEVGANARQMRQGLTWDNVAQQYEAAYEALRDVVIDEPSQVAITSGQSKAEDR